MTEVRDFDEEYADEFEGEGPSFKLGGQTFRTKKSPPPKAYKFETGGYGAAEHFLLYVIHADDRERFEQMVNDPEARISGRQVDQVAKWLIGVAADRPTK